MLELSNNLYLNTISFFPDCQELCAKKKLDENLFHQASFYFLIYYFVFIYKDIFKIVANDLPYLFLYIPDGITAINKKIENIDPAFIGIMHNQKDWEIKE